ncbi:glycosyltransferase family 4 protein [Leuconostoc pseudomesenteroides]|uniref:glycosyltransferase family 4 protein n=1 Tax=Leuconostoc pseudomesenteroides TaxID=33968 RepID=UPI001F558895|nr:glycosyltransferase family 4 protein [Leuconostoc pseudomesenteroides]MCT4412663.1 glycosyltransferase [Leuconostoc pseudomesenteroides]
MRINFVLPQNGDEPVGGYKVVYQYANYLVDKGHEVHIYFVLLPNGKGFIYLVSLLKRLILSVFKPRSRSITWYNLSSKIRCHFNVIPSKIKCLSSGKTIATFWKTAFLVEKSHLLQKNKFYLIQDYEIFAGSEDDVNASWHLPLNKIVIAKWLNKKISAMGEKAEYIPNFVDLKTWYPVPKLSTIPTVSMLWHENPRKGSLIGLDVLIELKKSVPNLKAILFGTPKRPDILPTWIQYYQNASEKILRESVYSQSDVYMMTSDFEGWGLTAMEAMAVGSAVVSTENGGIDEFTVDGLTVRKVPVRDRDSMKKETSDLLLNPVVRKQQVNQARTLIENFSLVKSGSHLEKALSSEAEKF